MPDDFTLGSRVLVYYIPSKDDGILCEWNLAVKVGKNWKRTPSFNKTSNIYLENVIFKHFPGNFDNGGPTYMCEGTVSVKPPDAAEMIRFIYRKDFGRHNMLIHKPEKISRMSLENGSLYLDNH